MKKKYVNINLILHRSSSLGKPNSDSEIHKIVVDSCLILQKYRTFLLKFCINPNIPAKTLQKSTILTQYWKTTYIPAKNYKKSTYSRKNIEKKKNLAQHVQKKFSYSKTLQNSTFPHKYCKNWHVPAKLL